MDELIARLEAADAGSRELELDIALAIAHRYSAGLPRWDTVRAGVAQDGREPFLSDVVGYVYAFPKWTRSLDAALTLVPEGFIDMRRHSDGWYVSVAEHSQSDKSWRGEQKPAALALCIAALKARNMPPKQK